MSADTTGKLMCMRAPVVTIPEGFGSIKKDSSSESEGVLDSLNPGPAGVNRLARLSLSVEARWAGVDREVDKASLESKYKQIIPSATQQKQVLIKNAFK